MKIHSNEIHVIHCFTGLLHPDKGQLVLAGDPKQLGPILRSPLALQYELGETRAIAFLRSVVFTD